MKKLLTISHPCEARLEIKKSQFISHLVPIVLFQPTMARLRDEHKKARHFVWATRQLNEHQQIVESCSDDGEPKNTSGKPTLKVLQGNLFVDVGIITVRYFGGIKLGTGGLVRAYNDAAQQVVKLSGPVSLNSLYRQKFRIPYQQIRQFEYLLQLHNIKVISKDFSAEYADFLLQGEEELLSAALEKIAGLKLPDPD